MPYGASVVTSAAESARSKIMTSAIWPSTK